MEPTPIEADRLYPRLHSNRSHPIYQRDLGRHMFLQGDPPPEAPISIPMLADIELRFVVEDGKVEHMLRPSDRTGAPEWDDMALVQQAFRNLRDQCGKDLDVQRLENGLFRIAACARYESAFLLLSNLWLQLEEAHGANLYAAVPTHKLLVLGSQDDHQAILKLQEVVRGVFAEEATERLLSKAIYQRWEGQWEIVASAF